MARQNGGLIGKRNVTSFGKCTVTSHTSTGTKTFQPGTRAIKTLIVAGGASGGSGGTDPNATTLGDLGDSCCSGCFSTE